MNKIEHDRTFEQIEGWLTPSEGRLLCDLASGCSGKGVIVEIGSWKGKSTAYLATGAKQRHNGVVYAIDPHSGSPEHKEAHGQVSTFEDFNKNISSLGLESLVKCLKKTSKEAAKSFDLPVEMIFIDGEHSYEAVREDYELWFPKLVEGGIMVFHDTIGWPGPERAVKELVFRSKYFKDAGFIDTITYAKKIKKNNISDRIRNRYVLFLKTMYSLASRLSLPNWIRKSGKRISRNLQGKTN